MKSVSYISIASVQKCRPVVTDPRCLPPSFAHRYYVVSHGGAGRADEQSQRHSQKELHSQIASSRSQIICDLTEGPAIRRAIGRLRSLSASRIVFVQNFCFSSI
jgi:hypothetical protein